MKKILIICLLPFILSACGSETKYGASEEIYTDFSPMDQEKLVEDVFADLKNSFSLRKSIKNSKPALLIGEIKNKTDEHIDTTSISDTIKVKLSKQNMFKIINRNSLELLAKEQELSDAGFTSNQYATKIGKLYGAKYVMYGGFSSIVNTSKDSQQIFYKFNLIIQNVETGEEVYIGESKLSKNREFGIF